MTRTLLLWILILNGSLKASESHSVQVEQKEKYYEVVRPVRLHTVRKRDAENFRPPVIKYAMTVGGKDIEMHLEKNNELLTKEYSETYYQEDGTQVTTVPHDIDHCYYQGKIVNDSESSVSISTCDGLRGYLRTSAQKYLIEPLSGGDEGDHALTTFGEEQAPPPVCGVTNVSWSDNLEPPTSRVRSRFGGRTIVQEQKYIELFLVADNRVYQKMNKDIQKLRQRIFEIVNFVNLAYKPLRTFIALVGLEVWSNGDQISITNPAGANLDAFTRWRNSELKKRKDHDNAHLISGIDFEGSTVGLAFVGTLCTDHSVGVIQDHSNNVIAVGATLAHEMGHNLGMNHDDSSACSCAGDSCIMAAALSWNVPRTFSSCSSSTYERYLTDRRPSCLLNKPDYKSLETPPVCGNGFKEEGEHCDCGTVNECTNPCCNATTCKLTEGSQCAEGQCCESCKILPPTRECRGKQDDCDLAENCDGRSNTCPEDVFAVNGLPCDGGRGYCYNGQCPQRPTQCVKMFGGGAKEAASSCYNFNTKGDYYGFCKRTSTSYIPCQQQDILCGKLYCEGGNANPNYGRLVTVSNCKASFFGDYTKDYGQVDTGTKCGNGMVCSQNECMQLEKVYRNTNCSAKCAGHGVCNHRDECHCDPGWLPPNCNVQDGEFSALSTGATVGIVLPILLVILGVSLGVAGFMWKKRQGPTLPRSHVQQKKEPVNSAASYANQRPAISQPTPVREAPRIKPKGVPPPPPPVGKKPAPQSQNYLAARQALRPVPHPKV
ncbi:Disintegrin and metalloproteinase domain-containing protein 28 [Oryzias melastigma]|uniref:Disintegrin and metalloproteinase domain-containing protein 28 n=1 Tax=Oryzias melastigma TaxID=30732 RepID=A0A834CMT5_ORYME|nr:Disintegrin and metalloproteinase domain-containing protein 28 [Oryzias melastigma]